MIPINKINFIYLATVAIAFTADAGAEVTFTGLEAGQEANARAVMPLASASCDSARWRIERLFRDSDKNARTALEALGYYNITIAKALTWTDACWQASFDISVGEPIRLRQVDVNIEGPASADPLFGSRILVNRPMTGDILNHGQYDRYKSGLNSAAIRFGYFDADFDRSEIIVDPDAGVADIFLHLQSGSRYRFGQVDFSDGILDQDILSGYSDIQTGDYYDADSISRLFEALNGSTYFKSVSISSEPVDTASKTVPVTVSLTPGARTIYSIGAGYATDTGPQGRLGYANRRRNAKGHQIESKLFASPIKSELTTSYRWPIRDPRKEWFSIVAGIQYEDTGTSQNDTYKLGILRTHNVSESWLETRSVNYSYENFRVGDQDESSNLLVFGVNRESATGRELSRTVRGRRLSFDISGASDSLGSDTSFLQFMAEAKWIRSLGDSTRIMARTGLGLTAKDDFAELPASVRYFAGGDQSVRGYEYKSLGPKDASGNVIGGSHLLTGSLEIDRLFKPQWAVAAFVDSGNAFNGTNLDFVTGAGIGIRWYSPVGPVRLDIAHPFDDPDHAFRIHISLGPDL